ncbi:MAG: epoxyqueuosine reductase, partial [Proteobacteria bacterium]|nr:epoxyqueuosine reductase [Pseudomonadota bacterium]
MNQTSEPSAWIVGIINDFIDNSPENTLKNKDNDRAFETPLVGFSSGDDPLYEAYKDHVGPFYMTPWEVVTVTFRDFTVKPGDLTVISWILPQSAATKADNRRE